MAHRFGVSIFTNRWMQCTVGAQNANRGRINAEAKVPSLDDNCADGAESTDEGNAYQLEIMALNCIKRAIKEETI